MQGAVNQHITAALHLDAAAIGETTGAHDAIEVDSSVHELTGHTAANADVLTFNNTTVGDFTSHLGIQGDVHQAITGNIQRCGCTRCQLHLAELGCDQAFVDNLRRNQGHQAGITNGDFALVDDLGVFGHQRRTRQLKRTTLHELGRVNIQRCGCKCGRVDGGISTNQHAVGVHKDDPTVSRQAAQNLCCRTTGNPVQQQAAAAWLIDLNALAGVDIKTLPVTSRPVAALIDDQGAAIGLADVQLTTANLQPLGQRHGHPRHQQHRRCSRQA